MCNQNLIVSFNIITHKKNFNKKNYLQIYFLYLLGVLLVNFVHLELY